MEQRLCCVMVSNVAKVRDQTMSGGTPWPSQKHLRRVGRVHECWCYSTFGITKDRKPTQPGLSKISTLVCEKTERGSDWACLDTRLQSVSLRVLPSHPPFRVCFLIKKPFYVNNIPKCLKSSLNPVSLMKTMKALDVHINFKKDSNTPELYNFPISEPITVTNSLK